MGMRPRWQDSSGYSKVSAIVPTHPLRQVSHPAADERLEQRTHFAGDGSARAAFEALSRELGIHDRVFLLGWRDDTRDLLAAFDCFALGSRSEGTSISLQEALAMGLPPAVTDVGGNADVLRPELHRQLALPEDGRALGSRIGVALHPGEGGRLGDRARHQG